MQVYLDDMRSPPPEWILVRTPNEAIDLLRLGGVTHLSLDHALGNDVSGIGDEEDVERANT